MTLFQSEGWCPLLLIATSVFLLFSTSTLEGGARLGTCPFSSTFYSSTSGTCSEIMLCTCAMATPLLCQGSEWQMVTLTAQGWLSAVLESSYVGAGVKIWMDGWSTVSSANKIEFSTHFLPSLYILTLTSQPFPLPLS